MCCSCIHTRLGVVRGALLGMHHVFWSRHKLWRRRNTSVIYPLDRERVFFLCFHMYRENGCTLSCTDVTQRFPDQLLSRSGGESAMRAQYIDMLRKKLESWCNNLIATEVEPWFVITEDDPTPPNTNLEGLFYSDAPKILFQMIDQQIDVAFSPGNPVSFVQALLDECMKTLERFVTDYAKSVQQCRDLYVGPTPSERPELLVEYMMTCGNNTIQIREYFIPQLREKVGIHWLSDKGTYFAAKLMQWMSCSRRNWFTTACLRGRVHGQRAFCPTLRRPATMWLSTSLCRTSRSTVTLCSRQNGFGLKLP
eukprot:m.1127804 g.1127804  ORF g.1127804 m.1127804 type:complete len:309 (-) comp24412_c0_seq143:1865-2791(-)